MSDHSAYDAAFERLVNAIRYLSLDEIVEYTNLIEPRVMWRMAEYKSRMLARQSQYRFADTDTVNYYNLLEFAQAIDVDIQFASQAWTMVIGEEHTNPHIIEELRQRQVEVGYIRGKLREVDPNNAEPVVYFLRLWVF